METCPICNQSAPECICMPKGLSSSGALCLCKLHFYSQERASDPQNKLIYFIKKNRNKRISRFIASELYDIVKRECEILGIKNEDILVSNVPRSKKAVIREGFDQSRLIADAFSDVMGCARFYGIVRSKGSKEQKKLNAAKRFRNVSASFALKDEESVKDKYVILFDDIVTTGASMAACVKHLRRAGAKGIICVSIAQNL